MTDDPDVQELRRLVIRHEELRRQAEAVAVRRMKEREEIQRRLAVTEMDRQMAAVKLSAHKAIGVVLASAIRRILMNGLDDGARAEAERALTRWENRQ